MFLLTFQIAAFCRVVFPDTTVYGHPTHRSIPDSENQFDDEKIMFTLPLSSMQHSKIALDLVITSSNVYYLNKQAG